MYKRSTWLANFSLYLMLKSILSNMEGMSRCITRAAVALCACLCGILTPLEDVYRWYFVQPCELMKMWVSFHPVLCWAGQKLGLSFRAESQWRGRISRSKIDWEQKGRGESALGVGDMEVGEYEGMCRCMLTRKDATPPLTTVAFGLYKRWVSACVAPSGIAHLKRQFVSYLCGHWGALHLDRIDCDKWHI